MSNDSEVLFSITRAHVDTGLRGFPVGTCRTSTVDPMKGVHYVGYPVSAVYDVDPEAAAYLLFYKELPTADQLAAFRADLAARRGIQPSVITALRALPKEGHPMEWLMTGLLCLGMTSKTGDWKEDALNLVARAPELLAAIFRLRSGWGDPIPCDPSLGLMEDFVRMLDAPGVDRARMTAVMRNFYVLHLDHGGGNLSTFVGKAVASGHADVYASMTGAMAALYGPLHGRANQDCLEFVRKVGTSDEARVEQFLRDALANNEKIFGFGHAVLRAEDTRASIQYLLGEKVCPDDPLFRTAVTLRKVGPKVLGEIEKIQNPFPNVDAVSGTLLNAVGFTDSNFYTTLFGLSRMTGIAAQIVDERTVARGGKGVPIYRPKYLPEGQPSRGAGEPTSG